MSRSPGLVPVRVQEAIDGARAQQLPELIAAWSATDDERCWFAWALRMDLPVLVERPELVLPCLARHCAWLTRIDAGATRIAWVNGSPPRG